MNKKEVHSLMEYLGSFELKGFNAAERMNYLNFSLDRFLKTLEIFPEGINARSRILELGASPYFMSMLVEKTFGCRPDLANYFNNQKYKEAKDILVSEKHNDKRVMSYRNFNVEKDVFPYKSGSYDLVVFCEIIEHLTVDPVHSLVEINRILKNGGHMIISTPNALRYENIAKLILGKNIYDHYSGYGAYGRHNREYAPEELRLLVEALGFSVTRLYTKVTGSIDIEGLSIKRLRGLIQLLTTKNRGSNIFLLARKEAETGPVYPGWLFESVHAADPAGGK